MKNKILGLLILLLISSLTLVSFAADPIRVVVDNETMKFPDAQPFIDENGRTQVPVRFVSEALGATVAWDGDTRTVSVYKSGDTIRLTIDQKTMYINGQAKELDTKAIIKESRTFVPLRFVSEALGGTVSWEGSTKTAYINMPTAKAEEGTKMVEGYEVKLDTDMGYGYTSERVEMAFTVNMMDVTWPVQKIDVFESLSSKFGVVIADEVYDHISQKKDRFDVLESKKIFVEETQQYIVIDRSVGADISISVFKPGVIFSN